MANYWLVQDLVNVVGWLYIFIGLIALTLAVWLPTGKKSKLITTAIVVGIFSILPIQLLLRLAERREQTAEFKKRYDPAKALFDERCKGAGLKIYKTVEDVDGVLLLNIRQNDRPGANDDPLWPDAGLPYEAYGEGYIASFLEWEHDGGHREKQRGFLNTSSKNAIARGYRFVDVQQTDGRVYRYRLKSRPNNQYHDIVKEPLKEKPARYLIDFTNVVDPEERKYWVAGTTIKITDTQTTELVAQLTVYAFEPGLGSQAGFRQPWRFSVTCPSDLMSGNSTRFFVDQILKAKQGPESVTPTVPSPILPSE